MPCIESVVFVDSGSYYNIIHRGGYLILTTGDERNAHHKLRDWCRCSVEAWKTPNKAQCKFS